LSPFICFFSVSCLAFIVERVFAFSFVLISFLLESQFIPPSHTGSLVSLASAKALMRQVSQHMGEIILSFLSRRLATALPLWFD
jgi:hypothetical protein